MSRYAGRLPSLVRQRALAHGADGEAWLRSLDERVEDLCSRWQVTVHDVLGGGTESLVMTAAGNGRDAIVKIGLPGSADLAGESRVYRLANGRGYPSLFAHAEDHNAILLERLGQQLTGARKPVNEQLEILCQTLQDAWLPLDDAADFLTGAWKCQWLRDFILDTWQAQGEPFPRRLVDTALDALTRRAAAHESAAHFLVHGDAHSNNTLAVITGAPGYKFVDPDGYFAEKACDLAVPMREYNDVLLAGNPARDLVRRARFLHELTGVAEDAIWDWGFAERISTSLVMLSIGMESEPRDMLAVAEAVC